MAVNCFFSLSSLPYLLPITLLGVPVFIIHGDSDEAINVKHAHGLTKAAGNYSYDTWIVEGAGHNNIEADYRELYLEKITNFVRMLIQKKNDMNSVNSLSNLPINTTNTHI